MKDLLLAFYGDDFTGSTDAMEALYLKGYQTVLFLKPPSKETLEKYPNLQCIGIAGTGRSKDNDGLEEELKPIMKSLSSSGARIIHYKTCSTFDSSPEVGSIGHAIKVSLDYFKDQDHVPIIVGAPTLGRYTYFGHHFAKSGEKVYRLDRHPIMSVHPSTPMNESDLGIHLSKQLEGEYGYFDVLQNDAQVDYEENYLKVKNSSSVVIHDVIDNEMLSRSAEIIWNDSEIEPLFVVGSSGVEYGLTNYWEQQVDINPNGNTPYNHEEKKQILVISGSASEITREQINYAGNHGYQLIRVPNELLMGHEMNDFLNKVLHLLKEGDDVVLYTAMGPDDENMFALKEWFATNDIFNAAAAEYIGNRLGMLTKKILEQIELERLVIAGGDTSGFVTKTLGIDALEVIQSVSPGAPLCIGRSFNNQTDIEIALKGGQFGGVDYFEQVKKSKKGKILNES